MAKVLEYLGIKKSTDNPQKILLDNARQQNQNNVPISSNYVESNDKHTISFGTKSVEKTQDNIIDQRRALFSPPPNRSNNPQIFANDQSAFRPKASGLYNDTSFVNQNPAVANSILNSSQMQTTKPIILEDIKFAEIKKSLNNLVEKTFPNPFPSRPSLPEDFDKTLSSQPFRPNHIEFLLENSKFSAKSKESLNKKYIDYKREMEFYKKFTSMNEIKKQKLIQEIDDFKARQYTYDHMNPNDPHYLQFQEELHQQEMHINREKEELEALRRQLVEGGEEPGFFGQQGNQFHQEQYDQFDQASFIKKNENIVHGYQPQVYGQKGDFQYHNDDFDHQHQENWGQQNNQNLDQQYQNQYGQHQIVNAQFVNHQNTQNQYANKYAVNTYSNPKNTNPDFNNQSGYSYEQAYIESSPSPIIQQKAFFQGSLNNQPPINMQSYGNHQQQTSFQRPITPTQQESTQRAPTQQRPIGTNPSRIDNPLLKKI